MDLPSSPELATPLEILPPVEFACTYGSSLLLPPNHGEKPTMVDYILGVADPLHWHSENLESNRHHYSTWMARFGPRSITGVAEWIGAGVHFNPFVQCGDKMIKYGVVGMQDLALDVLTWDRFYISGRLQKPVHYLVDHRDIGKVNLVNLKAATSAALLLLPAEFTEEELYAKVCSLSYMGDLRMLFAEDKNKVKKIVQGSFNLFQTMYRPFLQEYMAEGLLQFSSSIHRQTFKQSLFGFTSESLIDRTMVYPQQAPFSPLPSTVQNQMLMKLGGKQGSLELGGYAPKINISSRKKAVNCANKVLRHLVMVSSARQAVSGVFAAGGVNAVCYLAKKVFKAWKSRT